MKIKHFTPPRWCRPVTLISWTDMTSEKQLPDTRVNDPLSSGPKPPERKRRTPTPEVAESASKARDASCKTHAKMRHKISIFPRKQNKELDLETAQFILHLAAKMRHRRPEDRRGRRSAERKATSPASSFKTVLSDPGPWQPPPVSNPKPISHNSHRINKKLGSFLHFAPRRPPLPLLPPSRESSRMKLSTPSPGRHAGPLACAI